MRANIKTIAEACGVSTTTVSLVLNNKQVRVSPKTKQKIFEMAQKLDYLPSSLAVGLVTHRTKTIGLLVPDISNAYFSQVAKNLENGFGRRGYGLFLCNTNDNVAEQDIYLRLLLQRGVDAAVLCVVGDTSAHISVLDEYGDIPVVAFDRYFDGFKCPFVATDNINGAKNAVDYIIRAGHRRIACVTGPETQSSVDRLKGYKQALAENGIPFDAALVRQGDYRYESGYVCARELLKQKPTAIFACNDMMAYGVYKAIFENGLVIPDDISVVGYDDLLFSSMLSVPLTSVKQDIEGMCEKICELIFNALDGAEDSGTYLFSATTVQRQSVARPNE